MLETGDKKEKMEGGGLIDATFRWLPYCQRPLDEI